MPPTLDDWLGVLQPHLTEPLFDAGSTGRLHTLARELPGDCQGVLEARLASGAAPVDLSIRLLEPSQARRMAERISSPHLQDFLVRWSEPDGPFAPVRAVWLELDLDSEPRGLPNPIPSVKLPRGVDAEWLLGSLLPALHGSPLTGRQRTWVRRCLGELPAPGSLLYVFSLRSRGSDAVRLEVAGLDPAGIVAYLGRVAPATLSGVAGIAPLFAGAGTIHLSFDVSAEILPRIGIEGSFPRLPPREPRWLDLFGRLVENELCALEKRDAALAWPGYDTVWTAPERWPVQTAGARGFCVRSLSHLKVVCDPGRAPEAKVYLTFGWLPNGQGSFRGATKADGVPRQASGAKRKLP